MSDMTWKAIARQAQDYLHASIDRVQPRVPDIPLPPDESSDSTSLPKRLLPVKEVEITEAPVERLVLALAEKRYTAFEVTTAFLRRAVIAQSAVLCSPSFMQATLTVADELPYRASSRVCSGARKLPR